MVVCSGCGHENPDDNKFCPGCGSPLGAPAGATVQERKVVSSLFCDLVGFTAAAESADPEDVDRVLATYFAMARAQIEAHGGMVEKFIGDAVVGVFGVPAAHEDDPERAVRAGLRIGEGAEGLQGIDGGPLRLRVGINNGEVLVRLGVSALSGEGFMRGDAINTASRIQSVAPVGGVAVGMATFEATRGVFEYEELEPAVVKGKAEPIRVWEVVAARSESVSDPVQSETPLIGRHEELGHLQDALARVQHEKVPQLVTVFGVPGLGKSRLVLELMSAAHPNTDEVVWRVGRSLPYGDGVTYYALAAMVKAEAGILETDGRAETEQKLRAAVAAVIAEPRTQEWVEGHLRPLVGIAEAAGMGGDKPDEAFAAWRRFFEALAERGALALVFEDLHWADDNLLNFIEHLIDCARRARICSTAAAIGGAGERTLLRCRSLPCRRRTRRDCWRPSS
jgi:class 3 adenylate cyclase